MKKNKFHNSKDFRNTMAVTIGAFFLLIFILTLTYFRFQQLIIKPVKALPLDAPVIYPNITGEIFASGDFDNDGNGDLATISSGILKTYLGTGASAFSAPLSQSVVIGSLVDLKTADLNNDNNLDLVALAQGSINLGVFMGNGNGTFTLSSSINIGLVATSIVLADTNNDNNLDLLYLDANKFYKRLGNGTGSFQTASEYTGMPGQKSITSADFNNDNYSDIAIIGASVQIYINDGNGGFIEGAGYIQSGLKIIATEITNDNYIDLVFVGSKVVTFINKGNASFILGEIYDGGTSTYITGKSLFSGDYNNDRQNDVGAIFDNKLYLYYNQSVLYITYLSPPGVFVGESDFKLTVNGSGFNNNSVIRFNGNNKITVYKSPNQIEATISAGEVSETSTNDVTVYDNSNGVESIMRFFYVIPGFFDAQNFNTGTQPVSVYAAKFNGDNALDLAVVNSGSNNITVKLGRGDGMFIPANPETIAVNNQPNSIAGGDFNGDTNVDLVVANKGSDNLSVLMGNGLGGFIAATAITAGSQPEKVIVTDFNNDDNLDLAVACSGSNNIKVFLGNGLGGFAQSEADTVGIQPRSLVSADFNKDGFRDLAVTNYGSASISILLGNGNGTFVAADPATITTGLQPISVADADFNGDNLPDLIVANYGENTVKIFLGDGDGHFAESAELNTDTQPRVVSVQDFNGDDIDDYAVANYGSNNVFMVLGNGDGTFFSAIKYNVGTQPADLINGDFNQDGLPDLAAVNAGSNNISVILKRKIVELNIFKPEAKYGVGQWPKGITSGDIDGDGYIDLMVVNEGPDTVSLLHNDKDGTFTAISEFDVGERPVGIDSADLNGDGREDMVVTTGNSANYSIFLGKPDGTLPNTKNYSIGTSYPNGFASGDFNGDGINDVAVSLQPSAEIGQVGIYLGNGDTTYTPGNVYDTGRWSKSVTSGDYNNDGYKDIAVLSIFNLEISVLLGNGNGTFQSPVKYAVGDDPSSSDSGFISFDLNNDNNLDLILVRYLDPNSGDQWECEMYQCGTPYASYYCDYLNCDGPTGDGIYVFWGNGNGTFQPYQSYGDQINADFIIASKINNDSYYDLITGKEGDNQIVVLFNNGSGGFDPGDINSYPFSNPKPVIANSEDIDDDGDSDLAVATLWEKKLYIMINDGSGFFSTTEIKDIDIEPSNLQFVDINNDASKDIVISSKWAINSVPTYLNNGDGTFAAPINYTGASATISMLAFDNNSDGFVDIVSLSNSKKLIATLINNGDGSFDTPLTYTGSQGPLSHVLNEDFNNDGHLDLLVGPRIEFGDGSGRFIPDVDIPGMSYYSNTAGDFDEDGDIDLAGLDWPGYDRVVIAFNDGQGNFSGQTSYAVSSLPWDIITADFNGDDHLDLAVATQYAAQINMLMGDGTGNFSDALPANLYYSVQSIINNDFNGDGREDLAVLSNPDYLSILLGNNNLTFQAPVDYKVGIDPYQVITGDFNNDQRPDVAASNTALANISVFLGDVITAPQIYRPGVGVIGTPSKPVEFSCQALSGQTIRWSFDNISNDAIGFNLYATDGLIYSTEGEDITDINYIDESNLEPNTLYADRYVRIFNDNGESPASNTAGCYTLANEPLPLIINTTPAELKLIIDSGDGNPDGTDYAIYEYYSDSYLHSDGRLYKVEPQWRVYSGWGGSSGIKVAETFGVYDFYPLARNSAGIISGFRPQGLFLSCKAISATEINWDFKTPATWDKEGYNFYRADDDIASILIESISGTGSSYSYTENNLTPNSQYSGLFTTYKTVDGSKEESDPSNTDKCFTLANEPLPVIIGEVTETSAQIILNNNDGNPPETLYSIYEAKSGMYVQSDGSLGPEPFWQTYEQWGGENGIYVNVLVAQVSGQFKISLSGIDLSNYEFVAKVKNGDNIVTVEPTFTSVSASKGVAINVVASENTWLSKVAIATTSYQRQPASLRLLQEFSFLLNIILLILIIILSVNLYSTFKYLNLPKRFMEKLKYFWLIVKKEPALIFTHLSAKNNDGTYQLSYNRHRSFHINSKKALMGTAGLLILKVVILLVLAFGLAGLQYSGVAQVIEYNQENAEIQVGDKLSYIIRFANTGPNDAVAVNIADDLNPNLSYAPNSQRALVNGEERIDILRVETIEESGIKHDRLVFAIGALPIGQSGNITFDVLVNNTVVDPISNSAQVTGDNFDPVKTNTITNPLKIQNLVVDENKPEEVLETPELPEAPAQAPVSGGGSANLPPQAADDTAIVITGGEVEISVLANDSDPENQFNMVSFSVVTAPLNGIANVNFETGVIIYNSNADFVGEDIFSYKICDSIGQCAQANVSITVKPAENVGEEVNISILSSLFRAFTEDVSKTNFGEQALAGIYQNETVQNIINSKPVQFAQDKVLNNPVVEQVSQSVVTPTLVTVSVINTAPAIVSAGINFWAYLHFIFIEPFLLLFRKKRKNWGVVYDSLTKMPISLAMVRLYRKEDRRLIQTRVTDREGRYLIMVKDPGNYYLEVTKPNYDFPTKILSTEKMDTKYLDLYHGEEVAIKDKEASISVNIPLDVREKKVRPISAVIRSFALQHLKSVISYVGLILAVLVLIIYPSVITIAALVFHIIFYVTFRKLMIPAKPKGWGYVYDQENKQALHNVVVRLFDLKFNKLLETQLTDSKGRYAFLVGKNVFQILAEKAGYQAREIKPIDLATTDEIVKLDIALAKQQESGILTLSAEQSASIITENKGTEINGSKAEQSASIMTDNNGQSASIMTDNKQQPAEINSSNNNQQQNNEQFKQNQT